MDIKEIEYVMLIMKKYGTLENLEGSYTQRRCKGAGGELVTKLFNYREVFGNNFNYKHQVNNNKNSQNSPISFERNWATNYWPDQCHAYFLELIEVNENYLQG